MIMFRSGVMQDLPTPGGVPVCLFLLLILFFNVRNPVVMFFISYPGTFKWPVTRPPGLFYFWRIVCMFAPSSPKRYPLICEKVKSSLFYLLRPYFFGLQERPGCGGRLPRDHGGLRFTRSR